MKKYIGLFALSAILLIGAGCANQTPVTTNTELNVTETSDTETMPSLLGVYTLDTENSTVTWEGKKVGGGHHGTIDLTEGSLIIDSTSTSGSAVIDMDSIVDLDLEDAATNESLVTHLKSDDFFAVETYPTATFTFTGLTVKTNAEVENQYTIEGTLLLHGIENDITFDATLMPAADGSLTMTATIELDRSRWDVRYGSATLLDIAADKAISDIMTIGLDVQFMLDGMPYGDDALEMKVPADDDEVDEMMVENDDNTEEEAEEMQK